MYIGIDYGLKRIGLAQSDNGLIARPLKTMENRGDKKNIDALRMLLNEKSCPTFVLGLPLNTDGTDSDFARVVRQFGELLHMELNVTVVYQNERYTSWDAEHYIRTVMGVTDHKKIKDLIDAVAATVILDGYLDKMNGGG